MKPQKTQGKEERMKLKMNQELAKQFKMLVVAVYLCLFPPTKAKKNVTAMKAERKGEPNEELNEIPLFWTETL